jgi:DNA-binding CsgD family transcriptional regulator
LRKVRVLTKLVTQNRKLTAGQPDSVVFFEKSSGLARIHAELNPNLEHMIERMASSLAMQCLVRGSEPTDFAILVPARKELTDRLSSRAKELLEEGRTVANPASLSPRQREILHAVLCNQANKEIACKLNITVRTVKFHISTLLSKFGVDNRTELARRAAGFVGSAIATERAAALEESTVTVQRRELGPVAMNAPLNISAKKRSLRFQQRVLTA